MRSGCRDSASFRIVFAKMAWLFDEVAKTAMDAMWCGHYNIIAEQKLCHCG